VSIEHYLFVMAREEPINICVVKISCAELANSVLSDEWA
jgi:hypothetical protein